MPQLFFSSWVSRREQGYFMSNQSFQTWLMTRSIPHAISAVQLELRVPITGMRGSLQIIERYDQAVATEIGTQLLLTQIERLSAQIDRLKYLRHLAAGQTGTTEMANSGISAEQPIPFLNTVITKIHEDTQELIILIEQIQQIDSSSWKAETQQILSIFFSSVDRWRDTADSMLRDGLLYRLEHMEDSSSTPG
jgi:signal transduction histidine kinase